MLTLATGSTRDCSGMDRRDFLRRECLAWAAWRCRSFWRQKKRVAGRGRAM